MRKFFTLFTMCMLAAFAWADDIIFDPAVDKGNAGETASAYEVTKDGVTISVSNGLVAADKGVWAYRVYKGQTMTVTCATSDITKIVFECAANGAEKYGPGCFVADKPDYTYPENGNVGTWTGTARSVVFNAQSNQVRATKIIVTVGKAGLAKPVIDPAGGKRYEPFNVNITCSTAGAKIYYTTNGSTPTTSSTQFTAPFNVSSSTTVKAISAKDGEVSEVVEAAYEFVTVTPVANIKAYQQVADNTVVKFTNPVKVLAQSGSRMYVKDNTGYALFYGTTGQTYINGDQIPINFVGTKITYSGEPELTDLSSFKATEGNSPIDPEQATCSQVNKSMFAHYILIKEATFDLTGMLIKDATGEAPVYFNMNVKKADVKEGVTYDVVAVVGSYAKEGEEPVYQVIPVKLIGGEKIGLGDLANVTNGEIVTMSYDATVIWQGGRNNNYLYVKDETGYGLIYNYVGYDYFIGDVLKKDYTAKKTMYPNNEPNEPELTTPFTGFGDAISVDEDFRLHPEEITISQVNHDHWAHYVLLKNVMISSDGNTISRDGASCVMYNSTFNVPLPTDLSKPHDVYGIVAVFNNYQILPLSFDEPPTRPEPVAPTPVANLEEMYSLEKEKEKGIFTTPLTAIFHDAKTKYTYIQDVDGVFGLIYGDLPNHDFVNGTLINDAITTWSTYQGAPQLIPQKNSVVPGGMGTPVEPVEEVMENISQDLAHTYFYFDGAEIILPSGDETRMIITDGTEELQLFDKFELFDFSDPMFSEDGATFDVHGFLGLFNGAMQIFPISIKKHGGEPEYDPCDVNHDREVTVADVNIVIDVILEINKNPEMKERADVNRDGEVSVADINKIIAKIIGQ